MPFKDPEKRRAAQKRANKKFREAHPEQVAVIQAAWYKKNRKKQLARRAQWSKDNPDGEFDRNLNRKYGLPRPNYDQMVVSQGGVCKICKLPPSGRVRGGQPRRLEVDHDHVTGRVRGLLCHHCNVMLGQARDKKEVLQAAILYLESSDGD